MLDERLVTDAGFVGHNCGMKVANFTLESMAAAIARAGEAAANRNAAGHRGQERGWTPGNSRNSPTKIGD
jgi:hypothetical protein